MPAVKAPRSFVLPREMAKQPQRSFLSLYPALRLATVVAAMAFVVLFAGDLLINQIGGVSTSQSIPAAAPAPVAMQAPEMARQAVAPTQEPAAATAANDAALPPAEAPAGAGASAKASATAVLTETPMASAPTATPEATAMPDAASEATIMLSATPEPSELMLDQQAVGEQSAMANVVEAAPAPAINPLRAIEIALLVLVAVLGIATFVVRRKQA
jgi:hypothetical protein